MPCTPDWYSFGGAEEMAQPMKQTYTAHCDGVDELPDPPAVAVADGAACASASGLPPQHASVPNVSSKSLMSRGDEASGREARTRLELSREAR